MLNIFIFRVTKDALQPQEDATFSNYHNDGMLSQMMTLTLGRRPSDPRGHSYGRLTSSVEATFEKKVSEVELNKTGKVTCVSWDGNANKW